ncbi:Rv3235 family protein [Demequina activiva]|uniref:Ig-like domain-containing protein n=1 Tax=Demequina activiva TaxID=1582364 RepID=A0A919UH01_9MICO|nr:Rv3235 family protein [Demequina activiva]GIG55407.1 hypothetical protein Dac01nite_21590 [Demequina activiva]
MSAQPAYAVSSVRPYARQRRVLGDPTPLACTVAKAAMEAVLGGTSLDAYVRWVEPSVFAQVARQRSLARRASRRSPGTVSVRRARSCRVSATAAEVAIVVEVDGRVRPVAMRLEDVTGRWLVTEIHLG